MPRLMRSILVALLVAMLTISPATACHYCGGSGGGYYYASGGYYGGYSGGCGGCGPVYYESNSCCGGEVVASEGCGDCGACAGCSDGCDGCAGCESEGVVDDHGEPPMEAPEPPVHQDHSMPSTVNRVPTEPAPSLPPQDTHPAPPTETYITPSVEPAREPAPLPQTPPATMPAIEPSTPAVEPAADDLFSTPATEAEPLPVEEPATPSEADDFFSTPATEPAFDSTPATPPAAEPSDDDLFAPPAEEEPAEETPPADDSTETDDLFSKADAVLNQPGGLSSHSLRHWVDNTGNFSCNGRMLRMLDGKVQLLKDNGRTTTVPLARLSKGDLEFVNRQASAQKAETLGKTAQASGAWSN